MIEIEIRGAQSSITAAKTEVAQMGASNIRTFQHAGSAGEAGVVGLLAKIVASAIPKLIEFLQRLTTNDRDLGIKIVTSTGAVEFKVKDAKELNAVLATLSSHGTLPRN